MTDVIIIGDGPAGLSAALFLAKAGKNVVVFGKDKTAMHAAMLYNYLGIDEMSGSDFQRAARAQVQKHGAELRDERIEKLAKAGDGFKVETESGGSHEARFVIVAAGAKTDLLEPLGIDRAKQHQATRDGRSEVDGLYITGWTARPDKIQAIISAGDGAAAALDILSREAGKDIHDFDVPPKG